LRVLGTTEFPDDFLPEEDRPNDCKVPGDYEYARTVAREFPKLLRRFWYSDALEPILVDPIDFLRRLHVFQPHDRIWIGRENSSGRPIHAANFRTLNQWEAAPPPPTWSFTTGAAFFPGSFRRSKANVKTVRTLVLESDTLTIPETFAMVQWVEDEFSLPLLAAVSSGNKSLHCYLKFPGRSWIDHYGPALVAVGFDERTFSPAQPIRLAGQQREDNGALQSLLWVRRPRVRKSQLQRAK
jgi:hypothetical protein